MKGFQLLYNLVKENAHVLNSSFHIQFSYVRFSFLRRRIIKEATKLKIQGAVSSDLHVSEDHFSIFFPPIYSPSLSLLTYFSSVGFQMQHNPSSDILSG
ncbi:unnamed protein product [Citrullus colocynthis]|uniref:Transposase n=1 Tax=Citrullus colocynthis TaxID=252529 RepID=A0ABP0Z8X7_9ROSI